MNKALGVTFSKYCSVSGSTLCITFHVMWLYDIPRTMEKLSYVDIRYTATVSGYTHF